MVNLGFLVLALAAARPESTQPKLLDVRRISNEAGHSAFTDLVRFHDRWFLAYREGDGHVSPNGALRVLTSTDGETWTPAARITSKTGDLRDPKLSVAPDDRLMLAGVSALHQPAPATHQSMVWFSRDGRVWTEGQAVGEPNVWIWRPAWHDGAAYGVGYSTSGTARFTRLYKSADGVDYKTVVPTLFDRGFPNESTLAFLPDGTALCLMRRDGQAADRTNQLGRAKPPYTEWTWKDLGKHVGGPALIQLPDGRILAGGRSLAGKTHTALFWLDPEAGTLDEFLALPSGGDTSYPGLVWFDDVLWVSYYSSHEGKTAVYLARVKLPAKP